MKTVWSPVLVLASIAATEGCSRTPESSDARAGAGPGQVEKRTRGKWKRGTFTVGKATTYLTTPLDADGQIDYAAALNERLRKGVTPENNANALLWKAIGPNPGGIKVPPDYFKLFGIPAPPAAGNYFVSLDAYLRKEFDPDPEQHTALAGRMTELRHRPWTAKDQPEYHAWLNANEQPLAVVIEATKRTKYYAPLVPNQEESGQKGLFGALLPGNQSCREFAAALCVRAMRSTSEGNADAAWQDLLSCHRLGRLVGRGGALIDGLVGVAIDRIAFRADLAFLDHCRPDAKRLAACVRDLQALPPLPDMAEKVDLCERYSILDTMMMLDMYGFRAFETKPDTLTEIVTELMLYAIDWDPVLEAANHWVDRFVANMRVSDRTKRADEYRLLNDELKALRQQDGAQRAERLIDDVLAGTPLSTAKGRAMASIVVPLLLPAVNKVQAAAEGGQQTQDVVVIAFALAWYHRDNGRYPDRLGAVVPKYLPKVPADLFSGKALVYRPAAGGYLLYGVGANGLDDGGRGPEDEPAGDDITVRIPQTTRK